MPIPPKDRDCWPALRDEDYIETSPATLEYNCVAHAADNSQRWWSPIGQEYWPAAAPRRATVAAFKLAFATIGYEVCESAEPESGYEKIAIYVGKSGEPKHVARQLATGRWTSKLGMLVDIDHVSLQCLAGDFYGEAEAYMRRPRATQEAN